jgi:hypothetical protein
MRREHSLATEPESQVIVSIAMLEFVDCCNYYNSCVIKRAGKQNTFNLIFVPRIWTPEYNRAPSPECVSSFSFLVLYQYSLTLLLSKSSYSTESYSLLFRLDIRHCSPVLVPSIADCILQNRWIIQGQGLWSNHGSTARPLSDLYK